MRELLTSLSVALLWLIPLTVNAQQFQHMDARRLQDLAAPRADHAVFSDGKTITVAGGHTTGFVPTTVVETYTGRRHVSKLRSLYEHDDAFSLQSQDGRCIMGGGFPDYLGVGQSFVVEAFYPSDRSFAPLPCLATRRAMSSAVELSGRRILVSGNWYAPDDIEIFEPGTTQFRKVKDVTRQRNHPYILRTSSGNAMVFGSFDNYGNPLDSITVDRLEGDSFTHPLLTEWRPVQLFGSYRCQDAFMGDELSGEYSYLFPAIRGESEIGIILTRREDFSLLPLDGSIPATGPDGPIHWYNGLMVSKSSGSAWLWGIDDDRRAYLARIGYSAALEGGKASLSLYRSDPLPGLGRGQMALLSGDRIAMCGGVITDNYHPTGAVYVFSVSHSSPGFIWWILAVIVAAMALFIALFRKRPAIKAEDALDQSPVDVRDEQLFRKIRELMEGEQLYRRSGLSLSDLATMLGTNTKYISASINAGAGCAFNDFVNAYRIRHAQTLMKDNPKMRLSEVAEESGFASDVSFFRNFKSFTGMTPSKWLQQQ